MKPTETNGSPAPQYVTAAQPDEAGVFARIQIPNLVQSLNQGLDQPLPASATSQFSQRGVEMRWRDAISSAPNPWHRVLSARDGNLTVGFVACAPAPPAQGVVELDGGGIEIVALEVDEGHTGRGHGSRLLAALIDTVRPLGAKHVRVWVVAGDRPRINFYQQAGLRPLGLRRSYSVGEQTLTEHLWWASL